MWNAWKKVFVRGAQALSRGLVWWFQKLGENPSLSRDPGIVAWQLVSARKREEEPELPAGELAEKGSDDDDGKRPLPDRPLMRRAVLRPVRRVNLRRSLGALHQPAFVPVRIAHRRSLRSVYRVDRGDLGA